MKVACPVGDANDLGRVLTFGDPDDVYAFTLTGNHSTQAAAELIQAGRNIPVTREAYVFFRSCLTDDQFAFLSVYENTLAQEEAGATSFYKDYASPINLVTLIRAHFEDMGKPTPAQRAARGAGKTFSARLDRMESPRTAPGEIDAAAEEKRGRRHRVLVEFEEEQAAANAKLVEGLGDAEHQLLLIEVGSLSRAGIVDGPRVADCAHWQPAPTGTNPAVAHM